MRAFHLILTDDCSDEPRRIDFFAEGPDHAFQIARNEADGIRVELWEQTKLLALMTKSGNLWKLHATRVTLTKARDRQVRTRFGILAAG